MNIDWQGIAINVLATLLLAAPLAKFVGSKWIENRFAQRLQDLRHAHDRELASLKFKIDHQLDRAVKLNQREFEVLPEIWSKVADAHAHTLQLVSPIKRYPDFSHMNEEHRAHALATSPLSEWQKNELVQKRPAQQTIYYAQAMYWHELHDAKAASWAATDSITKGAMFLSPEAFAVLEQYAQSIYHAIVRHELNREARHSDDDDAAAIYRKQGQQRFDEMTAKLRQRYWAQ